MRYQGEISNGLHVVKQDLQMQDCSSLADKPYNGNALQRADERIVVVLVPNPV